MGWLGAIAPWVAVETRHGATGGKIAPDDLKRRGIFRDVGMDSGV